MRETGAPSTGTSKHANQNVVLDPPGVDMVAPLEGPRNAQQGKVKPRQTRWGEKRVSAAKNSIKAGARKPRPDWLLRCGY